VNAHLFRHIGSKLFLDANPGGYEVIRRVLGHKKISTTMRFYTGFEGKAAARHFDQVILGRLQAGATATGVRGNSKIPPAKRGRR
jgi:integrase